jgi:serine protease Do
VDGAAEIIVRMSDRTEYEAELIGSDQRSDLALLKIEADKDLPVLKMGNYDDVEVGQWVLAIGSPFGFDYSVTAGIVSAKGRSLTTRQTGDYVPFIQTDVAINPGNSGGPLFSLDGEVIGINAQIYSNSGGFMGVSFAIPIDIAMGRCRPAQGKRTCRQRLARRRNHGVDQGFGRRLRSGSATRGVNFSCDGRQPGGSGRY